MIHRLALLMGGAGATGVLALALSLNGSSPAPTPDAFVPVANDVAGEQLAQAGPTDPSAQVFDPEPDPTAPAVEKQVDTVYVLPAPTPVVVHTTRPGGGTGSKPDATPRPPRNDGGGNGGGNVAGDDAQDDEAGDSSDDEAAGEDEHDGGDRSDDGGSDDGGHEPGDD